MDNSSCPQAAFPARRRASRTWLQSADVARRDHARTLRARNLCALLLAKTGLDRETLVDLSVAIADLLIGRTAY